MREREIENGHMPLSSIKHPEFVPSWNRHTARDCKHPDFVTQTHNLSFGSIKDPEFVTCIIVDLIKLPDFVPHHKASRVCSTWASSHRRIQGSGVCVCSHTHILSVIGSIKLPEFVALYASKHPLTHTHRSPIKDPEFVYMVHEHTCHTHHPVGERTNLCLDRNASLHAFKHTRTHTMTSLSVSGWIEIVCVR
jgi:hypothetical protein